MKPSGFRWMQNEYPLIDRRLTRGHCLEWMESRGYPRPPRSACVFCPYKNDAEWADMEPSEFAVAVEVDRAIRQHGEAIHSSGQPLEGISFDPTRQRDFFQQDCLGMCGV